MLIQCQGCEVQILGAVCNVVVGNLFQVVAADLVLPDGVGGEGAVGLMVHGGNIEVGHTVMYHGAHIVAVSHVNEVGQGGVVGVFHKSGRAAADAGAVETRQIVVAAGHFEGVDVGTVGTHTLGGNVVVGNRANLGEAGVANGQGRGEGGQNAQEQYQGQEQGQDTLCCSHVVLLL